MCAVIQEISRLGDDNQEHCKQDFIFSLVSFYVMLDTEWHAVLLVVIRYAPGLPVSVVYSNNSMM